MGARDAFDTLPVVENRPPEQHNYSGGGGGGSMGMGMQQGGGARAPPPAAPQHMAPPPQRGPVEIGAMSVAQKQKGKSIASLGGGGGKDDLDFSGDELDDDL